MFVVISVSLDRISVLCWVCVIVSVCVMLFVVLFVSMSCMGVCYVVMRLCYVCLIRLVCVYRYLVDSECGVLIWNGLVCVFVSRLLVMLVVSVGNCVVCVLSVCIISV